MRRFLPTGEGHRATSLELLFDLVFVYAITAINSSIADRLTVTGLTEGLVLMGLTWFGWSAYAWLGNQARADEGPLRTAMYVAMAGYFVAALTIHEAFGDAAGGLSGPLVFVVAYAVIRLAHLAVYRAAAGDDRGLRRTISQALATTSVVLALLFAGAFVAPVPRLAVWAAAVLIDYAGIFVGSARGWRVAAPGHFAERHAAVVIIAIGESVVSVAVAISRTDLNWPLLLGALLGIALAITLWRTYFNAVAVAAEHRLRQLTGDDRTRMARDAFTYLHLPVVAGIIGLAVGLRVVLGEMAAHRAGASPAVPGIAMAALYGGAAVYLLALSALRWRVVGRPSIPRLVVAGWLTAIAALLWAGSAPPLADVAVMTASFVGLATFDAIRYGRTTAQMRLKQGS